MLLRIIRTIQLLENPGYAEEFEVLKHHGQQQKKCCKQFTVLAVSSLLMLSLRNHQHFLLSM